MHFLFSELIIGKKFLMVCGLLMIWPTVTLQSHERQYYNRNLSGCTLRAADSQELLYAPTICQKDNSDCPAETWLVLNSVPFDLALWTFNVTDGLVTIKNEGKNGGYLTTFDGQHVMVSSTLGVESRNWVFYRSGPGKTNIENAHFEEKFLVLDKIYGKSSNVYLDPNPLHYWHYSCRTDEFK